MKDKTGTTHQVFIYPVIESESMQYRISDPDIFFNGSGDEGVQWVNLTFEELEVVLPDDVCDTSKKEKKFEEKSKKIPAGNTPSDKMAAIKFTKNGTTPAKDPQGVHSYTITGTVTKLKVIGHSDPRIIIY